MGVLSRLSYRGLACSCVFALSASSESAVGNPFAGKSSSDFFINPINREEYDKSISTADGKTKDNLQEMASVPSAYWIDNKGKIKKEGNDRDEISLEGILEKAAEAEKPQLCVFIWYDLPNRDCKAFASNGEICCNRRDDNSCDYSAKGDCPKGLEEYKNDYVKPFIEVLQKYQDKVPIVIVVEPDSLPNLATNLAIPWCGSESTHHAYREGIKHALDELTTKANKVTVYLDAAHGGWLGWENSMEAYMKVLKDIDLPMNKIRGFATNVANYQPLGIQCPWCPNDGYRNDFCLNGKHKNHPCCEDPCGLLDQWNNGNNELNYAQFLVAAADDQLRMKAHVIIDTGRNGVVDNRQKCDHWCNPRGSGAGVKSTADTANTSYVDAYFWLKTPGESDGCTKDLPNGGGRCRRFDTACESVDSWGSKEGESRAPEAGRWFDDQVKELALLANFEAPEGKESGSCEEKDIPHEQWPHPDDQNLPQDTPVDEKDKKSEKDNKQQTGHGKCAPAFQQCGGNGWKGATCCDDGCTCDGEGDWYKQCEPPAGEHTCSAGVKASRLFTNHSIATSFAPADRQQALKMTFISSAAVALALGTCWVAVRAARKRGSQYQSTPMTATEELTLLEGQNPTA